MSATLPAPISYDVAVVGGGVAGCYTAFRLLNGQLKADSELGQLLAASGKARPSVGLFEYSGRVGGRLLSVQLPNAPAKGDTDTDSLQFTEFGGFRFQPQMHIVRDLATYLGLTHQPFPVDDPTENPVLLRGRRFSKADVDSGEAAKVYALTDLERLIVTGELKEQGTPDLSTFVANQVFRDVLPNDGDPPPYQPADGGPAIPLPNGWYTLQQRYMKLFEKGEVSNDSSVWAQVKETREQYEAAKQVARFQGRLFTDWPWWGLMTALLSQEAVDFLEDSGGYNSLYSAGNGPQGIIESFYFSDQPTDNDYAPVNNPENTCTQTVWKHISEGYAAVPNQLYQGFLGKGGNLPDGSGSNSPHLDHRNRQLLSFNKLPDGGYELVFFKRESNQRVTTAQAQAHIARDPTAAEVVRAKVLVLAMPKHSLSLLDQDNFFFRDTSVQQLLDTVIRIPAQRFFMAYPNPWWTDYPAPGQSKAPSCGRSTTDLNVRQFYYWFSSTSGGPSTVLASYTNGQAEEYWRGLQSATEQTWDDLPGGRPIGDIAPSIPPPATMPPSGVPVDLQLMDAGQQGRGPRGATRAMASIAHRQLVEVVGADLATTPEPIYAHYQDWSVDPWGAGWHAWKSGANDDQVIPRIYQPVAGERVHICGECWSNVQGWVQGALNSAETLVERLGLDFPSWLEEGGTWLGPGSST